MMFTLFLFKGFSYTRHKELKMDLKKKIVLFYLLTFQSLPHESFVLKQFDINHNCVPLSFSSLISSILSSNCIQRQDLALTLNRNKTMNLGGDELGKTAELNAKTSMLTCWVSSFFPTVILAC